jgi:hypothetical protein
MLMINDRYILILNDRQHVSFVVLDTDVASASFRDFG